MTAIIQTLIGAIRSFNVSECVKDYKGNIEPQCLITEDLNIWAKREVASPSDLEEWLNCKLGYSDYHKDVHGIRPRWDFSEYTLGEWRKTYTHLEADMKAELQREKEQGEYYVAEFKKTLAKTMQAGAGDFTTALRWLLEAEDTPRNMQDVESFLYEHNILYTDYGQKLKEAIRL